MATVKIPAFAKGIAGNVFSNALADASVYAFESDLLNYDTGTSVVAFAVPEDAIVMGVGIEVVTAFTAANAGTSIDVTDSASNILAHFEGIGDLDTLATFKMLSSLRRYAKTAGSAGVGSKAIEVDVNQGGASAGTFRIWLQLKPNRRNSLRRDLIP